MALDSARCVDDLKTRCRPELTGRSIWGVFKVETRIVAVADVMDGGTLLSVDER